MASRSGGSAAGGGAGGDAASAGDDDNVRVVCRVRPANEREMGGKPAGKGTKRGGSGAPATGRFRSVVDVQDDGRSVSLQAHPEPRSFTFDEAFGPDSTQEEVFQRVARPISQAVLEGYNGTIFAYGQTGSGKTHTILGAGGGASAAAPASTASGSAGGRRTRRAAASSSEDLRGVLPRALDFIFSNISRADRTGAAVRFLCKASFLEIYNERVYDLLDTSSSGSLQVRENIKQGVYVDGLGEELVATAEEAENVMRRGAKNRHIGSTAMNRESSRSHSVFTVALEAVEADGDITRARHSRFHLIDLAGSERQKSTGTRGSQLKEASSINKSLSALGNVINALVDVAAGKQRHVHYRDSKLTYLLSNSLGGNSKTVVIATVGPSADCFGETLSTLKFATRAKQIRNKAVVNEDLSGSVRVLRAEIKSLRAELLQARAMAEASQVAAVGPKVAWAAVGSPGSSAAHEGGSPSKEASAAGQVEAEAALARERERVAELEKLLHDALDRTVIAETASREEAARAARFAEKEATLNKAVQHHKMMLKLRNSTIEAMRKQGDAAALSSTLDEAERQELSMLREHDVHHPDVVASAVRVQELEAKLRAIESGAVPVGEAARKQMRELTSLNSRLTVQVRDLLGEKMTLSASVTEHKLRLEAHAHRSGAGLRSPGAHDGAAADEAPAAPSTPAATRRAAAVASPGSATRETQALKMAQWREEKAFEERLEEARQETEAAQAALSALEVTAEALRADLSKAEAATAAKSNKLEEVEAALASVKLSRELEVGRLQRQVTSLEGQLDGTQATVEASSAATLELESAIATARKDNHVLSNLVQAAKTEAEETKAALASVEEQLAAARASSAEQASALESSKARTAELEEKVSALDMKAEALNWDADEAKARAEEAKAKLKDTEKQLGERETEIGKLTREIAAATRRADTACFELDNVQEDLDTMNDQCQFLQGQLAEAKTMLTDATKAEEAARGELDAALQRNSELTEAVSRLEATAGSGEEALSSAMGQLREVRDELSRECKMTAALRGELADAMRAGSDAETARDEALKEANMMEATVSELTTEVQHLREQLTVATGEAESANGALADATAEVDAVQANFKQLEEQLAATEEQHSREQAELIAEGERRQGQLDEARARISELTAAVAAAEAEADKHAASLREAEVSLAEQEAAAAAAAEEARRAAEETADRHATQVEALQQAVAEARQREAAAVAERDAIAATSTPAEEAARFKNLADAAKAEAEAEHALVAELRPQVERIPELEANVQSLVEKLSTAEKAREAREEDFQRLTVRLETAEGERDTHAAARAEMAEDLECRAVEVDSLRGQIADRIERELTLQSEVEEERSAKAASVAAHAEAVAEAGRLRESLATSQKQLAEAQAKLAAVRRAEEDSHREASENKDDMLAAQEELTKMRRTLKKTSARCDELELQNARLLGHQNHQQKIRKLEAMKAEINTLKEKEKSLTAANFALMKRLEKAGLAAPGAAGAAGGDAENVVPAVALAES